MKSCGHLSILIVLLCAQVAQADPNDYAEQLSLDEDTLNTILAKENALTAPMGWDYRINQTQGASGSLQNYKGFQNNQDSVEAIYKLQLSRDLVLSHDIILGITQEDGWRNRSELSNKRDVLTDTLKQSQISKLIYQINDQLKFTVFNTLSINAQNTSTDVTNATEYGSQLEWKPFKETVFTPQIVQSSAWSTDNYFTEYRKLSFPLQQNLFGDNLSLTVTPSALQQNESWTGYSTMQNEAAVDAYLSWKINPSITLLTGNRFARVNQMIDYSEVAAQSYYVEWQQKATRAFFFRLRSEYLVRDTYQGDSSQGDSYQENAVRFMFGPKVNFSDSLSVSAEFQYLLQQALIEASPNPSNEKIFSISVKKNF